MGKLLRLLGILLIIVGIGATVYGFIAPFTQAAGFTADILKNIEVKAEDVCQAQEKLKTVEGATTYTAGAGYRHSVTYFCVDQEGHERNVTDKAVQKIVGGSFGSVGSFLSGLGVMTIGPVLLGLGVVFLIIGVITGRRSYTYRVVTSQNADTLNALMGVASTRAADAVRGQDSAAEQLRKLENLYNSNLITREEYEKVRQQILDKLSQ